VQKHTSLVATSSGSSKASSLTKHSASFERSSSIATVALAAGGAPRGEKHRAAELPGCQVLPLAGTKDYVHPGVDADKQVLSHDG